MSFPYVPINWQDSPSTSTPVDAAELNKNDSQVKALTDALMVFSRMGPCGSRPAANTVRPGGLYACTDTGTLYESDGASTWAAVATSGGGGGSVGASAPAIRRLLVYGHSYTPYQMVGRVGGGWVRDFATLVGIMGNEWSRQVTVPAADATHDWTAVIPIDDDGFVEQVVYQPVGPIASPGRQFTTATPGLFGWVTIGNITTSTIPDPANGAPAINPYDPRTVFDTGQQFFGNLGPALPHDGSSVLLSTAGGIAEASSVRVQSLHTPGGADPGGMVLVRFGHRIANFGVGGSSITTTGVYAGGWAKLFLARPLSAPPATEVDVKAASGTTITCDGLLAPIGSGVAVTFRGGVTASTTAAAGLLAGSLTVNSTTGVVAGMQGFTNDASNGQAPGSLSVLNWGINDAANTMTAQVWGQALRACSALCLCSYYNFNVNQANIRYANGTGGGTWIDMPQTGGGQFPGTAKAFSGTVGGNPTVTIDVGPAFEGGTIDLFFYAIGGPSHGGAATITVDGAAPPNGVCRVDTSVGGAGIFPNGTTAIPSTTVTAGSPNISTSSAPLGSWFPNLNVIGAYLFGQGVTPGTRIATGTSSTAAVMTANGTVTATGTVNTATVMPIVKRLTGLSAGAHTITITVTQADATTGFFMFAGYGFEARTPTAGVVVCNTARISATSYATNAAVAALNTETGNVLAGTSAVVGTNTVEPSLPASVVVADIDTACNFGDPTYFQNDGIHPNRRGAAAIAAAVAQAVRSNFTLAQTGAR